MIKPFLDDHFLLRNKTAARLYHDYAKDLPIIDYHNHLSPQEIAENKTFANITEVWLKGDHYKWRAMRANGIDETYITGAASDEEKFMKWAETVPYTMRNPLYHWTHLELQRYFGIQDLLSPKTAPAIYAQTSEMLQDEAYTTQGLLSQMKVELVCTTDYPTDSLEYHAQAQSKGHSLKLLPTFRPDQFLNIGTTTFSQAFQQLETLAGTDIHTYADLMAALEARIDYFHSLGCRLSDHGLTQLYAVAGKPAQLDTILAKGKNGQAIAAQESSYFQMSVLHHLAEMYHQRQWTMQLHVGAIRNNNSRLQELVGADVGCDSIGDYSQAEGLSAFLNQLDRTDKLPQTILYNLNPADNEVFATMVGNFNDGSVAAKVQWGSAWWFLDQKDGMEKQLNTLSNMGLLSRFVGMLTDSRSFLSFPRHEYFRRILCNLIGQDVHEGELPNDIEWLGQLIEGICYKNAKAYFNF